MEDERWESGTGASSTLEVVRRRRESRIGGSGERRGARWARVEFLLLVKMVQELTDRQTGIHKGRSDRQGYTKTDRDTQRQTDRDTQRQTGTHKDRQTGIHKDRQGYTKTDRQKGTYTDRQTERDRIKRRRWTKIN